MNQLQVKPIRTIANNPVFLVMFVTLMISLAFVLGYMYRDSKLGLSQIEEDARSFPPISVPRTEVADPKLNWLTYQDPINKITFKYPEDWVLHKPEGGNGADPCCSLWLTSGSDRILDISIFENNFVELVRKYSLIYSDKPENITDYEFPGLWFHGDLDGEYVLNINGKALIFQYHTISQNYDNGAAIMAGQILSTFKFNK